MKESNGRDLVIDDVEGENADGVLGLLAAAPAVALVVTHSHCGTELSIATVISPAHL